MFARATLAAAAALEPETSWTFIVAYMAKTPENPKAPSSPRTCFVIAPIGADGSPTRKRSDKLLKYVIERVLKPRDYKVERADKLGEPGIITNQIVRRIVDCDILIADLTEHNPNVFYELAIRHGLKKPFVHIIDAAEKIPFDNAQVRAIQVDLTDLDSVEAACQQLEDQITSIEKSDSVSESPISVAFDLENLKSSGKPDEAILATVLEEISALRREFISSKATPRGSPSAGRFKSPTTEEELMSLLSRIGRDDLADLIRTNFSVDKLEPGYLVLSLKRGGSYRDIDEEVVQILRMWTGRQWIVQSYPF